MEIAMLHTIRLAVAGMIISVAVLGIICLALVITVARLAKLLKYTGYEVGESPTQNPATVQPALNMPPIEDGNHDDDIAAVISAVTHHHENITGEKVIVKSITSI